MKKLLNFILEKYIALLYRIFTKRLTKEIRNTLKSKFRYFFTDEGWGSLNVLLITDIKFYNKDNIIIMEITLGRPGLLIGKSGTTINKITKHLNDNDYMKEVKIIIVESKLWEREK